MDPAFEHFSRHYGTRRKIYLITLISITCAFVSLFFIRVPVSVQARGMLTASTERMSLRAPVSGIVETVGMTEHGNVKKGDVLLTLNTGMIEKREEYVDFKRKELAGEVADLTNLIHWVSDRHATPPDFIVQSSKYRGQLNYLLQQLTEIELNEHNAQLDFDRYEKLYKKRMVSDAEFEKYRFALSSAQQQKANRYEQHRSQWQGELQRAVAEKQEFETRSNENTEERRLYTLYAPDHGTIQQFTGVTPGSVLSAGEVLGELSPDSGLIVRIQVSPADIGLIRQGMEVQFRVDAFDYTQWGFARGFVETIAADVVIDEGTPLFEVRCALSNHTLTLPNGYQGKLKKGMTVQASFLIIERTLFQLIYEKTDVWLNPQRL